MGKPVDWTNRQVGRWTIISKEPTVNKVAYWLCECICGNKRILRARDIASGKTRSCGCYRKELYKYRSNLPGPTHGRSHTTEHTIWLKMRQRCLNPKHTFYYRYGGRGIKICARWDKFENFYLDMGSRPSREVTLDRVDNNGDYSPENCRWASKLEQGNNTSMNHFIEVNGISRSVTEWSRVLNIPIRRLWARIERGWTGSSIITAAKNTRRKACT